MPWLEGWQYRKSHIILGSSAGDLTDYQMPVKVHYGSGVDSGLDVYLNGKCKADFGDIRFTKDDGVTELAYWMESKVDGDYALFWVKVPYIPYHPKVETGSWTVDGRTYHYRTKITITEKSGSNLTDYQVKVDIYTKWLVDNGYATSTGDEVRFTDSDGVTLLSFWRETAFNLNLTTYWVKIPSLPANSSKTIYIYYDASLTSVPSASNGDATFDFFSDGSSLDGWVNNGASVDSAVGNPAPSLKATGGKYAYKDVGLAPNRVLEFDGYIIPGSTPLCNFYFLVNSSGAGQMFRLEGRSGYSSGFASTTSWTSWSSPSGYQSVSVGVFHKVRIVIKATKAYGYIDDAYFGEYTFSNNGGIIGIHGDTSAVTGGNFDNIRVRKYVEPEPSVEVELEKTIIYIYYGNATATTTSNGENTFLFFDDFNGSSLDPNKWTVDDDPNISYSVADGLLKISGTSNLAFHEERYRATGYPVTSNVAVGARVRTTTPTQTKGEVGVGIFKDTSNFLYWVLDKWYNPTRNCIGFWREKNNGVYNEGILDDTDIDTNFRVYTQRYVYSSGLNYLDINYVNKGSRTNSGIANTTTNACIVAIIDTGTWNYEVDWFYIRKFVDPEPSHGSWGSQEAAVFLTESLGLKDSTVKASSVVKSELLGLSDTVSTVRLLTLTELLGLSDVVAKAPLVVRAESLGLLDYYSRLWSVQRTYSENLGLADYVQKSSSTVKSELLGLSDVIRKSSSILKSELLGLSDFYSRIWTAYRTYTETLGLSDKVSKSMVIHLVEALSLADELWYTKNPSILEKLIRKLIQIESIKGK